MRGAQKVHQILSLDSLREYYIIKFGLKRLRAELQYMNLLGKLDKPLEVEIESDNQAPDKELEKTNSNAAGLSIFSVFQTLAKSQQLLIGSFSSYFLHPLQLTLDCCLTQLRSPTPPVDQAFKLR